MGPCDQAYLRPTRSPEGGGTWNPTLTSSWLLMTTSGDSASLVGGYRSFHLSSVHPQCQGYTGT